MRSTFILLAALLGFAPAVYATRLGPCDDEGLPDTARCGGVTVPEDAARPGGRTIDLNVLVLRGTANEGSAPLFVLAGGPGQGATDLVGLGLGPWASVLEVRDMVFVDQRGTGQSNLIDCADEAVENPASVFGQLFDPDNIARCLESASKHADVRLYGTEQVVVDLELVRETLGYESVVLWGGSGGTRTALVWLRRFPESVEALLIDGVTPTYFRSPLSFAKSAQEALDLVLADCAAQDSCRAAYPDLAADFDEVIGLFDNGPVTTKITRRDGSTVDVRMGRGEFGYAIRGILYSSRSIAGLPRLIHEAARTGDVSEFAQRYWQRQVALRPVVSFGVHLSSGCTEDGPFIDASEVPEATDGTFLDTWLIDQYAGACESWQRGEVPDDYLEPVRSDKPVLLISGAYDPSTPPSIAEEVASHLPRSRHIVVRNEAHGAEFGCAREAAISFLRSASLEDLGAVCEGVGPILFEVPEGLADSGA